MVVGLHNMDYMEQPTEEIIKTYELRFADQRVHKNVAAFKLFAIDSDNIFGFFETTENYLLDILIARPDLVTDANVSQKK